MIGYYCSHLSIFSGIKVAHIVKKRGQPKGHELTTIGIPAKKAKKEADKKSKSCSFSRLHISRKEEGDYHAHTHILS